MQSTTPQPEQSLPPTAALQTERVCPACGATARRAAANFCATCGRDLEETYLPADTLRSSYYMQQQRLVKQREQIAVAPRPSRAPIKPLSQVPADNGAATTALAFVTYSLVPYLGILFCPGAIVMGFVGLIKWQRAPYRGGRRASYSSIILGLVILCAQIFLWWILYKVPQWTKF